MKKIIIFLILIFWPFSLYLNNKPLRLDFPPQTIFAEDYQAHQKILRDTKLYKTVFMARAFHGKARISLDKFNDNFFALIDPNNYFFGFAPRQIVGNQNLQKFPFASIFFFSWGLWNFDKIRKRKLIAVSLAFGIFGLSLLANFDKYDFVLWFPLSAILINGVNLWPRKYNFFFLAFIIFTVPELIRLFL